MSESGLIPVWGDANQMFSLSTQLLDKSEKLIDQLSAQTWFQPIQVGTYYPSIAAPPKPTLPGALTLRDVVWTTPAEPGAFVTLPPDIQGLFPGAFDGVAPTLNFGSLPQPSYGALPAAPTIDLNFTYPNPVVNLPTPPSLLNLDTITFNENDFKVADFSGVVPTMTAIAPNIIAFSEPARYTSMLLDDLTSSLQSALTDGTDLGLSAQVQTAMFDAAREREYRQYQDTMDQIDRDQEELGYALPSGVWNDTRLKARTELNYTMAGLSRDIMVKQADMRLTNLMKSRELAVSLESRWIDYANNAAQRVFETAKFQTEAAIEIYNADVKIYEARLRGFEMTITVYQAGIEAIKARVQVLNAEIQFEQAKASINTALVEQYKAQVQAAEAVLDIAKVQMEIVQTKASIEKTKVDVFGAQIQAFVATVNAYTAQVEGYKANAEAQSAIEGVFKTQVEAFTARVQAGAAQAGALVQGYEAQVKSYEVKLDGYKAQLQAMVEQARAGAEYNQASAAAYTAQVQGLAAYNEVLVKTWEAILNEQLQIAQVQAKVSEANGQLAISQRQASIEAIKGAAQVMGQLGAAALGAIHWSNSAQWSLSSSLSSSISNSTSNVEEHIFSQSA